MDQSLDSIIKTQKKSKKPYSSSSAAASGDKPVSRSNALESSLGDIIASSKQSKKDLYVQKKDNSFKRHSHQQGHKKNNDGIVITIKNDHRQQYNNAHAHGHHYNNHGHGNYNNRNNDYRNQQLINKKRYLAKKIDHSLFDARGIRDYSQVEKKEREEDNATLRVTNIAPSVTQSDLTKVFSVIGKLKDVDLLTHLTPVEAVVTYRRRIDAMTAIDRFNNVPIDGSELKISLELGHDSSPSFIASPISTTKQDEEMAM